MVILGLQHIDKILCMKDDLHFNFVADQDALRLLTKCVSSFLDNWPGGDPSEQESVRIMLVELNKALLELQYIEDNN